MANMTSSTDILGCGGCLYNFLLGLVVRAAYKSKSIWDPVIERFDNSLFVFFFWVGFCLGVGGEEGLLIQSCGLLPRA